MKKKRPRRMTMKEIQRKYPSEWILIDSPELDEHLRVIRGIVVAHSKDRDEVDRVALHLRLKDSAFEYTGTIPRGTAVVL